MGLLIVLSIVLALSWAAYRTEAGPACAAGLRPLLLLLVVLLTLAWVLHYGRWEARP